MRRLLPLYFKRVMALRVSGAEAIWAFVGQMVMSGTNFVSTILLVRALSLDDFGRFTVCYLVTMIVRGLLSGAILTPMSIIAPRLHHPSGPAYRGFLTANALVFAALSSLLVYAIFSTGFSDISLLPLSVTFVTFFSVLSDYLKRYHLIYRRSLHAFLVDASRYAIQLGLLIALVTVTSFPVTIETALLALGSGSVVGTVIGLQTYHSFSYARRLWTSASWRHIKLIRWLMPSTVLDAVQANFVPIIGASILGDSTLGLLRAAQSLAYTSNLPFLALQQIAPYVAATHLRNGDRHTMWHRQLLLMGAATIPAMLVTVFVAILSDHLLAFFYSIRATEGSMLLCLYLLINILVLVRVPFTTYLQVTEHAHHIFWSSAVASMLSVTLTYALPPLLGSAGLPLAVLLSVLAALLFQIASVLILRRAAT